MTIKTKQIQYLLISEGFSWLIIDQWILGNHLGLLESRLSKILVQQVSCSARESPNTSLTPSCRSLETEPVPIVPALIVVSYQPMPVEPSLEVDSLTRTRALFISARTTSLLRHSFERTVSLLEKTLVLLDIPRCKRSTSRSFRRSWTRPSGRRLKRRKRKQRRSWRSHRKILAYQKKLAPEQKALPT